jgi:hypothetical protein
MVKVEWHGKELEVAHAKIGSYLLVRSSLRLLETQHA